ncbi:nucleotidyltransferase domain-containing protein [Magnetococcales bacterium HHB-1]
MAHKENALGYLLFTVLQTPAAFFALSVEEQEQVIHVARASGVLARLGVLFQKRGVNELLSPPCRRSMTGAMVIAKERQRTTLWEVDRVARALSSSNIPFILLKGAAYAALDLSIAQGRVMGDLDIMVTEAQLDAAEVAFHQHGWRSSITDAYDQHYYRAWMHELPPMRHQQRGTELDVHHALLPRTSRLFPDSKELWRTARTVEGFPEIVKVLSPEDMVLHAAIHLFHDGDMAKGFRELLDIDGLLREFCDYPFFWPYLCKRAETLGLGRPLYYALHFSSILLKTPIPEEILKRVEQYAPLIRMEAVIQRALFPLPPWGTQPLRDRLSKMLIYLRSHWLRMPPWLLLRHLAIKSRRRMMRDVRDYRAI